MKLFSVLAFAIPSTAQLVSTGASAKINDIHYYISPYAQGRVHNGSLDIASPPRAFGFTPVTVVADQVAKADLGSFLSNWTASDDVWQPGFLSAVFLASHKGNCVSRISLNDETEPSYILPLAVNSSIPSGPYFLDVASGEVHQAFRLYRDQVGAFTAGLLQSPDGSTFQQLSAQVPASDAPTIGVPSRLYFSPTSEKPLAGVRVGVKEIYDLAGVKKSNGNRSWWHLYPPAKTTAPAIKKLIDAGAIIVGYQKTSQFANGESPTADWVDYHAPFNPRGDGYNNPSSSSAGAGASIGAYSWLDIAVGSDTGGSIRGPAAAQGVFGNRPSRGLVTLDGVMPLSPTLDTAGFITRSPEVWDAASKAMYSTNYTQYDSSIKYPTKIYSYGLSGDLAALRMMREFVDKLASFIGTNDVENFNLDAAWNSTGPESVRRTSLSEIFQSTYPTLISKEQVKLVREPFYADYAAAFDGRRPFVNPVPLARWAWGDAVPDSWHADAIRNKTIFMDWFNSKILPTSSEKGKCSNAILLYPGGGGIPSPRNVYGPAPSTPLGFFPARMSIFSEAPDSTFPLGEVASKSSVTGKDEYLPVAINVMVAKGCDGILPRLAQDLVKKGVLEVPQTGRTLKGGEILLKRSAGMVMATEGIW